MSLRSDLVPVVDAGRQLAADLGFRQRAVTLRVRTWDGGKVGSGDSDDEDTVLSPPPKVAEPPARLIFAAPGKYEQGDLIVSKISRTYAEEDLVPASVAGTEVIWLVSDEEGGDVVRQYRIEGAPTLRSFGWEVHLRRMNRPRA